MSARLATDGFTVIVNYASGTAAAAASVEQITAAGGRAVAVQADRLTAHDAEYAALRQDLTSRLAEIVPTDADVQDVADQIVRVVALPSGGRPYRVHVDPSRDGSEVVSAVADRIRAEFYRRVGIEDLLSSSAAL